MWKNLALISFGAVLGANLRWLLGLGFNTFLSSFALGTLLANICGCFLAGIFLAAITQYPQISAECRLFIMTGFLGSLTTFSAFSVEIIEHFSQARWLSGLFVLVLHLMGGLAAVALGFWGYKLFS